MVEHGGTHRQLDVLIVVAIDERLYLRQLLLAVLSLKLLTHLSEAARAGVLVVIGRHGDLEELVVAAVVDLLVQLGILCIALVGALDVGAHLASQLVLHTTLYLDRLVSLLDRLDHIALGHLLHLSLDHHDILLRRTDHQVDIGTIELVECRIDHPLTIETDHSHLREHLVKGDSADRHSGRGCQPGQLVGKLIGVTAEEDDLHVDLAVVVLGEEGTQSAVDQSCNQDLMVRHTALTAGKAPGEAPIGGELLLILYLEGHKVYARTCLLGSDHRCQEHGLAHAYNHGAISLLGKLACLDRDLTTIGQSDGLCDYIHTFTSFRAYALQARLSKISAVPPRYRTKVKILSEKALILRK